MSLQKSQCVTEFVIVHCRSQVGLAQNLMLVINVIRKKASASSVVFIRNSIRTNLWNEVKTHNGFIFRCAQGYKL